MKKLIVLILLASLNACAPVTVITGSWKSPDYQSKNYKNILVAALTSHAVSKATVENDLSALLNSYNITATKSINLFPPEISNSDSDRNTIMQKVKGKNIDAILTVSLLKKETESRYLRGAYPYNPELRFDYYRSFWGYYTYWYPYGYSPEYYTESTYYFETNLYDTKTEELVWSAQSQTYDFADLSKFSKDFANGIVNKLKADGILKPEANIKGDETIN
jgi:hypothetical protein